MVNLTINDKAVSVPEGTTLIDAAKTVGIEIPNLCYLEGVHKFGACRMCVVEVEGARNLQASCMVPAAEGMVVKTNTARVRKARKVLYELTISNHSKDCLSCSRNQDCDLQAMGDTLNATSDRFQGRTNETTIEVTPSITRDMSKCIMCRRCVTACNVIQTYGVINAQNRGFDSLVLPGMGLPLADVNCTYCGQCSVVCPVGAITETDATAKVWNALADTKVHAAVQVAPAIRAALGEEFDLAPGTLVTGKLVSALKLLGFDSVFDTNFTADLTILEEGTEFLTRVKTALTGGEATLPMITSCSPGWIKFIEHEYATELGHLSTCKSPHTMMGALIKSYYAEKIEQNPDDMFVVSIMPCTAKKFEIVRPEMQNGGNANVDAVLTTRELAHMIKEAGIDFANLPDGQWDAPLGMSTGAADIFGVTGGVMEAALRTVYELITGRELPFPKLHVLPIEGFDTIKEAEIVFEDVLPDYSFLEGVAVKVAVTSGGKGAAQLMDQVKAGTSPYHFIEVMGCPGGCIVGGGQPRARTNSTAEVRQSRLEAIYREDESRDLRKSHENPAVMNLYKEFLGTPNGHLSHDLLHTHYTPRGTWNELLEDK